MATPTTRAFATSHAVDSFHAVYPGAFSAVDIYVMMTLPNATIKTLGHLAAISISTHRDSFPVTSMPFINPRGLTQGHRTIAGTMMFHTIDRNAFGYAGIQEEDRKYTVEGGSELALPQADELPLFDVHITYVNELGQAALEALYGIRILDFGKTVSLENLVPIESYSYMALDYRPLTPLTHERPGANRLTLSRPGNRTPKPIRVGEGPNPTQLFDVNLLDTQRNTA